MKTYGVRVYPASVQLERGVGGTPIFVHGRMDERTSDFSYIFDPVSYLWQGQVFAHQFGVDLDENGAKTVSSGVREHFGECITSLDLESQVMLLKGEDFKQWGKNMIFGQGIFLPVFWQAPPFGILQSLCCDYDYRLTSETWPEEMRGFIHLWDNVYWELYSTLESDIQALVRAHAGDSKMRMYYVDLDREYPDPSGSELLPVYST